VQHQKLPLDTRPIPRPIHKKICPLSALSINSNSIIRHARLLRYGDATVAPVFPSAHSNRIFESARQLRCGVPQLLRHHQSAYTAPYPRECMAAPLWGAAATPASPSAYISSPSACISYGVGRRSCSVITKRAYSSPSAPVNSSMGCCSNSVITKRARSSPEGFNLKTPTIISNDRGTAREDGGKRRWGPRLFRRLGPIPGELRVGSRCIRRPIIVNAES